MSTKDTGPSKNLLIAALVCILIGVGWFTYEAVRPLSADEIKVRNEDQKREAEIAKNRR